MPRPKSKIIEAIQQFITQHYPLQYEYRIGFAVQLHENANIAIEQRGTRIKLHLIKYRKKGKSPFYKIGYHTLHIRTIATADPQLLNKILNTCATAF